MNFLQNDALFCNFAALETGFPIKSKLTDFVKSFTLTLLMKLSHTLYDSMMPISLSLFSNTCKMLPQNFPFPRRNSSYFHSQMMHIVLITTFLSMMASSNEDLRTKRNAYQLKMNSNSMNKVVVNFRYLSIHGFSLQTKKFNP